MTTIASKGNEIIVKGGNELLDYCPFCSEELQHAWQQTQNYDDSNPVRICHKCDTAWIWMMY